MGSERIPRPRVLVFSHRNLYEREVWRCSFHEFEGILPEIEAVDVVAPRRSRWYSQARRIALREGQLLPIPLNPGAETVRVEEDYELFFTVCEKPSELLSLSAARGWRERCRTSVCWLTEFYVKDIPLYKSSLEVLRQFDHVVCMYAANGPFREIVKGQCCYLPAGIDALRFCPYPDPPPRCVDVLSIGRRSEETHRALLRMASSNGLFYVYDTMSDLHAFDLTEHRALMANLAKRSRYFLVNPGKINAPDETGGQIEFGYRYVEGAAPGAILIGERPKNDQFEKAFDWEDVVIDLPYDSDQIGALIRELDRQPERQMRIRTQNIVQSLLRHDWAYRWESVLGLAGLEPLAGLLDRKRQLKERSDIIVERQFQ
jgi:hypothetical protein